MGGKNPLFILNAADLALAVECAVQGGYFGTGQRCTASSRFIVEAGVYAEFVERVRVRLEALRVDDACTPGTDIGPVVDEGQLAVDLRYIEIGKSEGARLVCGGEL